MRYFIPVIALSLVATFSFAPRHNMVKNNTFQTFQPIEEGDTSSPASIQWNDTLIISHEPVNKTIKNGRGNYGSQYGRMIKLDNGKWLAAYTVSRNAGYKENPDGGFAIEIAESIDKGRHWTPIGLVAEPGRDVDNAALIQLPDHSVLLGCRSVRWQESYRLPVYRSTDNGLSWQKLSVIDVNEGRPGALGHPDKGVYEPHFCFLEDGRLAVMYANEKHVTEKPSYSQIISERISPDLGKSWGKEIWVAYAPGHNASRPGMPVWTKMSGGASSKKNERYIVTYEICGPEKCNIYYKTSKDGFHWKTGLGTPIPHQSGAPYIISLADGTLILTSNRGNISISEDFGKHWFTCTKPMDRFGAGRHTTSRPWHPAKKYEADWTQTIWSSLYQTAPDEIGIISTVKRTGGGHDILMRVGKIE